MAKAYEERHPALCKTPLPQNFEVYVMGVLDDLQTAVAGIKTGMQDLHDELGAVVTAQQQQGAVISDSQLAAITKDLASIGPDLEAICAQLKAITPPPAPPQPQPGTPGQATS